MKTHPTKIPNFNLKRNQNSWELEINPSHGLIFLGKNPCMPKSLVASNKVTGITSINDSVLDKIIHCLIHYDIQPMFDFDDNFHMIYILESINREARPIEVIPEPFLQNPEAITQEKPYNSKERLCR